MAARKRTQPQIYELYLELESIEPLIWRRFLVPATITLSQLHDLLQLAMGWTNSHLHSFTIGNRTFGPADVDDVGELDMLDERRQTLETVLGESTREFLDVLAAINDPTHEEHDSMLTWIGGAFDPEGFDLNAVNRTLRFERS